jgi:hypothetical protein
MEPAASTCCSGAERSAHGVGRTYTISATATDLVGNVATATASCVVPHDQGKSSY